MMPGFVYCSACGIRVLLREVEAGRAKVSDGVYVCGVCAGLTPKVNSPPLVISPTKSPKPRDARLPAVPAPPPRRAAWIPAVVGIGVLALAIGVLFLTRARPAAETAPAARTPERPPVSERKERSALENRLDLLSSQARADVAYEHACDIERCLIELRERAPGLESRIDAVLREYREGREKAAGAEVEEVLRAAKLLENRGRIDEALRVIDAFPKERRAGRAWESAAEYRKKLEEKIAAPRARPWHALFGDGVKLQKKKMYAEAKQLYLKAMEGRPATPPKDRHEASWYYLPYNLAEVYGIEAAGLSDEARAKAAEECRVSLTRALNDGYAKRRCRCHGTCAKHFRADRSFDAVRSEAWFKELESGLEK